MDHRAVLERVVAWAKADPNIRVLVLTGSVASNIETVDEHADLDIELYVTDPSALLASESWYHRFGEVLVIEALENPGWHPTRLVYYADGKIDFMVASVDVLAGGVFYDRPFRMMVDKNGDCAAFQSRLDERQKPPTAEEFLKCVHWFYAAVIMWARLLARDDPWAAKMRDWDSKTQLLKMLEWDHRARKGWDYDTWYNGAHLHEWMDPDLVNRVGSCWSGFSREDSIRALRASLSLFDAVSTRTAVALGIEPFDGSRVRQRVEYLLINR